jgi:exocyst complex component 2
MALELTQTYVSLISTYFSLSDEGVLSPTHTPSSALPTWIPPPTNSITTSFYLQKILTTLSEYLGELTNVVVEVSQGEGSGLRGFLDSVRWKFEDILAVGWKNGVFHVIW